MENNFTVHIFGYGETQYITKDVNFKVSTTELATVQPLVDAIWAEKPVDVTGGDVYHAINIFNYDRKDWQGKGKDNASFSVKKEDDLTDLINAVIAEISAITPK
jgi:hypothetical protein